MRVGTRALLPFLLVAAAACGASHGGGGIVAPSVAAVPSSTGTTAPGSTAPVASTVTTPDDDPAAWTVDTTVDYDPVVAPPTWVVPSPALPAQIQVQPSNNNVAICFHEGRLYFAWRTSALHFAGPTTRLYVMSTPNMGASWDYETEVFMGTDLREPSLLSIGGRLFFRFFQAGSNPVQFTPIALWRCERLAQGSWTTPVTWGVPGEVAWDVKVRGGNAYMTSYVGTHYGTGPSAIDVRFQTSANGIDWAPVTSSAVVYTGGVSEVGFELDETGGLWAVTRDEDGDSTGWGSHVINTAMGAAWPFPAHCDPRCFESPKMFRHGKDLYLIGRRDPVAPFDLGLVGLVGFDVAKWINLVAYSLRPKRTTLHQVDRATHAVNELVDLAGCGDTCYPAVCRLDADTFLVANYTSPLTHPDWPWIEGQLSPEGTQLYLTTIHFKRR
jgi:hypothetical protein